MDALLEESKKIFGSSFYDFKYWEWVQRRIESSGPLTGKDIDSIFAYIRTKKYEMLTPNAVKVLYHCLYSGGSIND